MITVAAIEACVLTAEPLVEIVAGREIKVTRLSGTHRVHTRWQVEIEGWHGKPIARSSKRAMYYVRSMRRWAAEQPPPTMECPTCLGNGMIRDAETDNLRRCLDCGGAGAIARRSS